MITVDFNKLVKSILDDDAQKGALSDLAKHRLGLPMNSDKDVSDLVTMFAKNGIHYIPENTANQEQNLAEIEYLSEMTDSDLKNYGVNENNHFYFNDNFVIPVRNSKNQIIFYIVNNIDKDGKRPKYVNTYSDLFNGNEVQFKVFGMHNTLNALKQGRIVVTEGVFDSIVLSDKDIPTVALLGTKLVPYHKQFLNRFDNIIYIPDNDVPGETAWKKFKREFPNAIRYDVPLGYKDSDEFISNGIPYYVDNWITDLEKLKNKLLKS